MTAAYRTTLASNGTISRDRIMAALIDLAVLALAIYVVGVLVATATGHYRITTITTTSTERSQRPGSTRHVDPAIWVWERVTGQRGVSGVSISFFPPKSLAIPLYLLVASSYFVLMEWLFGGTIGKQLLGLRVVSLDSRKISWQQVAIRTAFRLIDGFPYIVPYLLGLILVMGSSNHLRLGDRVAKTMIVRVVQRR